LMKITPLGGFAFFALFVKIKLFKIV